MNIYVVVEGEVGEKKLYENWIPYVNENLTYAPIIDSVTENNFYIVKAGGYPNIFNITEKAIEDVISIQDNNGLALFDRLVVVVDSEDDSLQQRMTKVNNHINSVIQKLGINVNYKVVIQHFCLETWGLANKKLMANNIKNPDLAKYIKIFNVFQNDPENLPELMSEDMNRAQFADKYLRLLLNNKFRNLSYSKNNPEALLHNHYYTEVCKRHNNDHYISSFSTFLSAFI